VNDGEAYGPFCPVIDVGSQTVCAGVKAKAACRNIRGLWPTSPPTTVAAEITLKDLEGA
jgi:hypothetical protein